MYMRKNGFTLIEMLTVVLIIGVLTAVALPQYRRAIRKAEVSEAVSMLRLIRESGERLATEFDYRDFPTFRKSQPTKAVFPRMDMLDSSKMACTVGDTALTCEKFTYALNENGYLTATKSSGPYSGTKIALNWKAEPVKFVCVGSEEACDVYGLERKTSLRDLNIYTSVPIAVGNNHGTLIVDGPQGPQLKP